MSPEGLARLFGPEHQSDAMGMYERLRKEHGSVAPVLLEGDLPAWLVLGYRENLDVVRTPSRFSRDSRTWRDLQQGNVAEDSPLLPLVAWQPLCCFVDGDEHERLRAAVTDGLSHFDRRGIRRYVTRFANALVDEFAADGKADLVEQFAQHLPMLVMTQLLGMPDEYGPRLVQAATDLTKGSETAYASNEYIVETLTALVARKRATPGHDLPSWLMEHSARLSDEEVMQHLRLILVAANENTRILIINTLRMVLTDRRFRGSLAGGQMTLPDAVEQMLWDEPPTMVSPARWATNNTELGGQAVKAGDMLLLGLAPGNVDPAIRPDPSASMNGNRSHLAFSGGPHECPGQDIGRAITETAVDVLLARLPDTSLAVGEDELRWVSSWLNRQLVALPVRFTPKRVTSAKPDTAAQAAPAPAPAAEPAPSVTAPATPDQRPQPRTSWWRSLTRWLRRS